jgi:SAM-dependent methyltransferase
VPEIANAEQAAAWDGPSGAAWVEREELQNRALRAHTERLFAVADVGRGDRVLDVGCGCGETTREAARRTVDGEALGVDLSAAMLARARERAARASLTNVQFEQADAQVHAFVPESFDLTISRFGSMFFADPVAAFANIGRATVHGGRLALVVWQEFSRNEWVAETRDALAVGRDLPDPPSGVPGPFGLADPDQARGVLDAAGFDRIEIVGADAPFRFGATQEEAVAYAPEIGILRGVLEGLAPDDTARALDALRVTIAAHETDAGVVFDSRVWIITAFR